MPVYARFLFVGLAAFMVWTMVRGFRTGVVYDDGWTFDENQDPFMFALSMFSRGVCVAFVLWLAAGYDSASFLRLLGLSSVLPWFAS